jgi:hypothetical protein
MSESKKIIEFNSDMFSVKKTRKRKEKNELKPVITASSLQNRLMREYRDKKNKEIKSLSDIDLPEYDEFNSSMSYLDGLSKVKPSVNEINTELPESLSMSYQPEPEPPYGCLKNGTKPTFRELKNDYAINKLPVFQIPTQKPEHHVVINSEPEPEPQPEPKYVENTIKLTKNKKYTLGRSKNYKRIGILIKDKQTRKNIMNSNKELKSVPLLEIKNHLKKKGLIKAGSTASSDLLRTMYENSVMAGDILNTNKETLLHNFTTMD